ncbi:hypothetical protein N7499_012241 [Penicillium canescens]|nr:hypothetical protein N7522_003505 [Penicillium canescens]KAJ6063561.1 hypothetical protein N7499_012241 [Penicillium canescens]
MARLMLIFSMQVDFDGFGVGETSLTKFRSSGQATNCVWGGHQDECLPGTRSELLNEIAEWAMSPERKCISG